MTTSRIVRGTKGRIFLYVCGILIVTGIIACYNNTRLQLEDLQKNNEVCRQQQEHLTSQLQVIFDYKQRLEKSLKAEKVEHQQSKNELESKLKEDKEEHEKVLKENKIRFTSLQQQYKLLQRQFNDFKEESSKMQKQQLNEINSLQAKLKEVQGALNQLINEKESLERQLKNSQMAKSLRDKKIDDLNNELNKLKKGFFQNGDTSILPPIDLKRTEVRDVNFSKQIPQGKAAYEIKNDNQQVGLNESIQKMVIDSLNNSQNVLQSPYLKKEEQFVRSSTRTNDYKANIMVSPLGIPSATPETKAKVSPSGLSSKSSTANVLPMPNKEISHKVPDGFVPIVQHPMQSREDKNYVDDMNLPGRYGNKPINENIGDNLALDLQNKENLNKEIDDKENGAHENLIEKDNKLEFNRIGNNNQFEHIDNLQQVDHEEVDPNEKNDPDDLADEEDDIDYHEKKAPPVERH